MKKQRLSLEVTYKVYDDDTGTYIEVSEDRDSLELIELRFYDDGPKQPFNSVMMTVGEAQLVSSALFRLVNEMKQKYPDCDASVV